MTARRIVEQSADSTEAGFEAGGHGDEQNADKHARDGQFPGILSSFKARPTEGAEHLHAGNRHEKHHHDLCHRLAPPLVRLNPAQYGFRQPLRNRKDTHASR